jgi:uncharacterized phage protein (TIGR02218 family)
MSAMPEGLKAHLEGRVTTLCHCWRVTRRDGTRLGFTDHDRAIDFDDTDFEPQSGFSQSEAEEALGLAADRVDIEGALDSDRLVAAEIEQGAYDGAKVETFLVNWTAPDQRMKLREAMIGTVALKDGRFVAELESPMRHLDRPNGRYLRRHCDAELGDARCGVDLDQAAFRGTGTVAVVLAGGTAVVTGLDGFAEGWFAFGVVTWTSGALEGQQARVREHRFGQAGTLLVFEEAPSGVAVGDLFEIVAGCDKAFSTCKAKFANPANFRGFPHLPGNDAAYGYASEGQEFDGGPIVP